MLVRARSSTAFTGLEHAAGGAGLGRDRSLCRDPLWDRDRGHPALLLGYLGLLVVVGHLLHQTVARERGHGGAAAGSQDGDPSRPGGRKSRRALGSAGRARSWRRLGLLAVLPYALVLALILSTVAYGFVSNQRQLEVPGQILWSSLTQRMVRGSRSPRMACWA